jgi:hypothetical protein
MNMASSVEVAEHHCYVMRYAVRDALPDLVRRTLLKEGIKFFSPDVIDGLVDDAMKTIEATIHKVALAQ